MSARNFLITRLVLILLAGISAVTLNAQGSAPQSQHRKPEKPATNPMVGASFGGGKVFWLDPSGRHGLVAAPSDLASGVEPWSSGEATATGATADSVGGGQSNSLKISQKLGRDVRSAANQCLELLVEARGIKYDDWYLPSRHELNLLFQQRNTVGGFNQVSGIYWSSTESSTEPGTMAWEQEFKFGAQYEDDKDLPNQVRCIRKF